MTFNKCSVNGRCFGDILDTSGEPINPEDVRRTNVKFNSASFNVSGVLHMSTHDRIQIMIMLISCIVDEF